jgi:hypothetical protein
MRRLRRPDAATLRGFDGQRPPLQKSYFDGQRPTLQKRCSSKESFTHFAN